MTRRSGATGARAAAAVLSLGLILVLGGCAHLPAQGARTRNVITADEIEQAQAMTAYEAIEKLQPTFLVARGPTSLSGASSALPNVYMDDVPYGPLASLREIPAQNIALIRLYPAWEATYRFGTGNMGGVIDVFSRH